MEILPLVLAALATYRLTRLVTADQISANFRSWIESKSKRLGYAAECDWCLSIWFAPFPAAAVVLWPTNRVVLVVLLALSLSALAGFIALFERRLDK